MPRYSEATLAAIKQAVDIVAYVGEHLPLHRSGSKFKALCPFHDDHNPSLELNSERQSFKCWSCGAGGDIFDFVQRFEKLDFPEALRMLAERGGIALESPPAGSAQKGVSRVELFAVSAWAEQAFAEALTRAPEVLEYVAERGIGPESVARFRLGYAPDARDWLTSRARREGYSVDLLERAGLIVRPDDSPQLTRERFRGRLMFPIHDLKGRVLGFGGRILPHVERSLAAVGKNAAKYLNSSETPLFQKRRVLYAADLARAAAREAGWVAVVEGYTDVIAAHQVGLGNVVGTLGTALGDDHVIALRRLADRVVLIFDGDEAGQSAADRSLELFLGHEVDLQVLTLPAGLDPCDFLLKEGADAFRSLVDRAIDPLAFAVRRAESRFDLDSIEGTRQAAEWVLAIVARIPASHRVGLDLKVAKALDALSRRLRVPVKDLERRLKQIRQSPQRAPRAKTEAPAAADATAAPAQEDAISALLREADRFDPLERELVKIILNQPVLVDDAIKTIPVTFLRNTILRNILAVCYELAREDVIPTFERVSLRLEELALRAFAAGLLESGDSETISPRVVRDVTWEEFRAEALVREGVNPHDWELFRRQHEEAYSAIWLEYFRTSAENAVPQPAAVSAAPWRVRLDNLLPRLLEREKQDRIRELQEALKEVDETTNPADKRALQHELYRLQSQRPDTKKKSAS